MKAFLCILPVWLALSLLLAAAPPDASARELYPNAPDPFCSLTETTQIEFMLDQDEYVEVSIRDYYDGRTRLISEGNYPAGTHSIIWDGMTHEGNPARTGLYSIRLWTNEEVLEDPCTVFCGDTLAGPFRQPGVYPEEEVAFAIGLESGRDVSLVILDDDATHVRSLYTGPLPAGVSMMPWDLRDDGGVLVPNGYYVVRLTYTGELSEILFQVTTEVDPATMNIRFRDVQGEWHEGSLSPLEPAVIRTPLTEGWIEFDRPFTEPEILALQESHVQTGSFEDVFFDSVEVVNEGPPYGAHVFSFEFDSIDDWDDAYGPGSMGFDLDWVTPDRQYFHLHNYFSDITHMDEVCNPSGPADPGDWNCSEGGWPPADLYPACPNPVEPGGMTTLSFSVPYGANARLAVVDTAGYEIRLLFDGVLEAGQHVFSWDLRDEAGDPVPEWIYHVIYEHDGRFVCSGDVLIAGPAGSDPPPLPVAADRSPGLEVQPNPAVAGAPVWISFQAERTLSESARLAIYDASGRCVCRLGTGLAESAGGRRQIAWQGTDDSGRRLPSGLYFVRLPTRGTIAERSVLLIR